MIQNGTVPECGAVPYHIRENFMKKLHAAHLAAVYIAAVFLLALFLCTYRISDISETSGNDLGEGLGLVLSLIITIIPSFLALPVAALLAALATVTAVKKIRGTVLATLIVMSVYLPFLFVCYIVNIGTLGAVSTVYLAISSTLLAVYVAALGVTIAYYVALRRGYVLDTE